MEVYAFLPRCLDSFKSDIWEWLHEGRDLELKGSFETQEGEKFVTTTTPPLTFVFFTYLKFQRQAHYRSQEVL